MKLEELDSVDLDSNRTVRTEETAPKQQELSELMEENSAVVKQISESQQEDANCKVLIDRYKSLTSQYKADLQRLDFIARAKLLLKEWLLMILVIFAEGRLNIMMKVI